MSDCKRVRKSNSEYNLPVGRDLSAENFKLGNDGSITINNRDIAGLIQKNVRDVIVDNQDLAAVKVTIGVDF